MISKKFCGDGEIRTRDTVAPMESFGPVYTLSRHALNDFLTS